MTSRLFISTLVFIAALLAGGVYCYFYAEDLARAGGDRLAIPLDSFAVGMTEAQVLAKVKSPSLTCVDQPGFFMGSRICQARIRTYLDVPALFVAFFFKDGGLSGIKVDVPNAHHRAVGRLLLERYGAPTIDRADSKDGVRLVRWKLAGGKMVYNHDRAADPKIHSTILWISETQAAAMGVP